MNLCLKEKIEKHKALAEKAYILEENKNLKTPKPQNPTGKNIMQVKVVNLLNIFLNSTNMVENLAAKISFLPDPCSDRQAKTVEPPPNKSLDKKYLFPYSGKIYYYKLFTFTILL